MSFEIDIGGIPAVLNTANSPPPRVLSPVTVPSSVSVVTQNVHESTSLQQVPQQNTGEQVANTNQIPLTKVDNSTTNYQNQLDPGFQNQTRIVSPPSQFSRNQTIITEQPSFEQFPGQARLIENELQIMNDYLVRYNNNNDSPFYSFKIFCRFAV